MRFEIVNTLTGEPLILTIADKNPVVLGSGEDADVRLRSGWIGGRAVSIGVGTSGDWELWNEHGRPVVLGDVTLYPANPSAPIRSGDSFTCMPFEVRVFFDQTESATAVDEWQGADRRAGELVREIHVELIGRYGQRLVDREAELKDEYIQKLEEDIAATAARVDGFPRDDRSETSLGDHLAGIAVRSELLSRLVARSGESSDRVARKKVDGWDRLRTGQRRLEEDLDAVVRTVEAELGLSRTIDLTEQTLLVDAEFWTVWRSLLDRREPPVACRWYLANRRLKTEIKQAWYGFGPLDELLDDPTVSEIMVVDRDHIFIEKRGRIERTGRRFLDDESLGGVIGKIVDLAGRQVNTSEPMADARMPDGSRVNAVLPPVARRGPCLTIRRFPTHRLTIDDLVAGGSLSAAGRDFLRATVENRRNIIVAGGTGSGKTTLLNGLSGFIPDHERIVTIEDTAELRLHKEHVVVLEARQKNAEGKGEKSIRDLVTNALRMRPDRIVVGECRGGEALDMLQAMNTGHDGSLTTIHANTPNDVVSRLEVLCQRNPDVRLPVDAIHRQIVSAVDLIIQLGVVSVDGRPRKVVTEITEVVGLENGGGVRLVRLFARDGAGSLRPTGHLATFTPDLVASGRFGDPLRLVQMSDPTADTQDAAVSGASPTTVVAP